MLTQPEGDRESIIFCGSTGLTDSQRRWSMTELELGAVVYGLQSAYNFTYGADKIQVMTDHQSLVGLSKKCLDEIQNPRLTSLLDKIAHYNYKIKAIQGKNNVPADVLSRMPNTRAEFPDVDHFIPVQVVEIKAVQTRGGKLRIARGPRRIPIIKS